MIHSFEDGIGRIGRTISEKSLAIGARQSPIISLSSMIERDKRAYYQVLERANTLLDITEWLIYFSEKILEAHYPENESCSEYNKSFVQWIPISDLTN